MPWEADKFYAQPGMAKAGLTLNVWPVGTGPYRMVDYVQDRLASRELTYLDELGFTPRRRLCCTGMPAQIEAASLGMGLIMAPPYAVPDDGRLVPVLDQFFAERSFWLAAPTDLYRLQRVRAVWNMLREYSDGQPELFLHKGDSPAPRARKAG